MVMTGGLFIVVLTTLMVKYGYINRINIGIWVPIQIMILMYHDGFSKRSKHTIQHLWKAGLGTAKISFLPSFELLRRRLWGPILNDSRWSFRHGTLNSNSSKSDNMYWKPWGVHGETPIETQISRESTPCHLLRFSHDVIAIPVDTSALLSRSDVLELSPFRRPCEYQWLGVARLFCSEKSDQNQPGNSSNMLKQLEIQRPHWHYFCGVQGGAKK